MFTSLEKPFMKSQEQKLLKLLESYDVTFFIPPYQRNYEWDESQCERFWDDVLRTYKLNESQKTTEHFFGTLTYFQSESAFGQPVKLVLIDGQQRVTTAMLFLIAMRDLLQNASEKKYIDEHYLKNEKVSENNNQYKVKLKQVETDWPAYESLVLGKGLSQKEMLSAVYRNYRYFKVKLKAHQMANKLTNLIDKGLSKFSIVTIELEVKNPWENPQDIFESMNSLGKPLSLADLVRNYLLMGKNADEQDCLYRNFWLSIENQLHGNISEFLRDFLQLRTKRAQKQATQSNAKELYRVFKEYVGGNAFETKQILLNLERLAPLYSYIISGVFPGKPEIGKMLSDLLMMKASVANSFLLGLFEEHQNGNFKDDELYEILDAFRIYIIRQRLKGIHGAANKSFPELVKQLDDLRIASNKREMMFAILSGQQFALRVISNVELQEYLDDNHSDFYHFGNAKFILALIEEALTKSRPDLADPNLQVEHIMPQTLSPLWKQELGGNAENVHLTLCHSIGNLTLIRHNQQLGNQPFQYKKAVYENNAGLQIAKTMITNCTRWDESAIKNRTHWIVDVLLQKVLPIPDFVQMGNFALNVAKFNAAKPKGLSFNYLGIVGKKIQFCEDPSISATVVSDDNVEFEGKIWNLSPLTRELKRRNGTATESEAYRGSQYWEYEGVKLEKRMNI